MKMAELIPLTLFAATIGLFGTHVFAEYPVAGVKPDQRPEGAPIQQSFKKNRAWYKQARKGVSKPYPPSLKFLDDQGRWYTPFNQPGMKGPYDIRAWHK